MELHSEPADAHPGSRYPATFKPLIYILDSCPRSNSCLYVGTSACKITKALFREQTIHAAEMKKGHIQLIMDNGPWDIMCSLQFTHPITTELAENLAKQYYNRLRDSLSSRCGYKVDVGYMLFGERNECTSQHHLHLLVSHPDLIYLDILDWQARWKKMDGPSSSCDITVVYCEAGIADYMAKHLRNYPHGGFYKIEGLKYGQIERSIRRNGSCSHMINNMSG